MFNNTWGRRPGFGPGPGFRPNQYGNRFIGGGFAVPFLLGGLTGGLLAPSFYPRPYYPPYPAYPPYPVYYR